MVFVDLFLLYERTCERCCAEQTDKASEHHDHVHQSEVAWRQQAGKDDADCEALHMVGDPGSELPGDAPDDRVPYSRRLLGIVHCVRVGSSGRPERCWTETASTR